MSADESEFLHGNTTEVLVHVALDTEWLPGRAPVGMLRFPGAGGERLTARARQEIRRTVCEIYGVERADDLLDYIERSGREAIVVGRALVTPDRFKVHATERIDRGGSDEVESGEQSDAKSEQETVS